MDFLLTDQCRWMMIGVSILLFVISLFAGSWISTGIIVLVTYLLWLSLDKKFTDDLD